MNQTTRQLRLMWIDDEPFDLDLMEQIAVQERVTFMFEDNAYDALKELHRRHYRGYDAIVMDISMPTMNGRKLTEELREKERMFQLEKPLEIFWYTGWKFDLENPEDPFARTFNECCVRKLFIKAEPEQDPLSMVREIKELLTPADGNAFAATEQRGLQGVGSD